MRYDANYLIFSQKHFRCLVEPQTLYHWLQMKSGSFADYAITQNICTRSQSQLSSWFTAAEKPRAPEFRFDHVCRVHAREFFWVFRNSATIPRSGRNCPTSTNSYSSCIRSNLSSFFLSALHCKSCYITFRCIVKPTKITRNSLYVKMSIIDFIYVFSNLLRRRCFMNSRY